MTTMSVIDVLLVETAAELTRRARLPEATYRLQFHAGFTFRDAAAIVPYLHDLGITDLYASPYLKARPGSRHGYDISDHRSLNPEVGSEDDYDLMVAALRDHGMGQLLDVVPNHMGIIGNANPWWNDVLENGPASPYASFFDIDWHSTKPDLDNRVLLPFLGDSYGQVLESQQLQLRYEAGVFTVHYFDHRFPVSPKSYLRVLTHRLAELEPLLTSVPEVLSEYQSILTALRNLPSHSARDPARLAERQREKEVIKRRLAALTETSAPVRTFIDENVSLFNGRVRDPHSFDLLDELLNEQVYRLAYWRVAADEINYRRFFDINELAALSMERSEVFNATHELIFRLLRDRKVTGLRIDHPDGLFDPRQYLERLQVHYVMEVARALYEAVPRDVAWSEIEGPLLDGIAARRQDATSPFRKPLYVIVEKILGTEEPLPEDWPVSGTTGYEFLNVLNGIFVDTALVRDFNRIYNRLTDMDPLATDLVYESKFLILRVSLAGELHMLAHQLDRLSERNRRSRDFTLNSLRHALREVIACFPVYRSYIAGDEIHPRDRAYVEVAVARARRKNAAISGSLFQFVRDMLLLRYPDETDEQEHKEQRRFVGKFQQVTAPVMAKGLEDTSFYVYNRLVSLNDVGGDPGHFGVSVEAFHSHNQDRQAKWPWGLSATSTHDTKRSEDVRARLNVLSEIPKEWSKRLTRWTRLNRKHRVRLEDLTAPDPNDEYLFYQTLIGAWPLDTSGSRLDARQDTSGSRLDAREFDGFVDRVREYMVKAIHEAKVHTSWVNPNPPYDDAVRHFVTWALDANRSRQFLEDVQAFARRVSHWGMLNSLGQVLLKITSPGVADIYQGQELWDFSLVDPDNRRPVDYERRRRLLGELRARLTATEPLAEQARDLVQNMEDGRIKLYVTHQALTCRRDHPELFAGGEYHPMMALGGRAENICAFARRLGNRCAIVVVPRFITQLVQGLVTHRLGWTHGAILFFSCPKW